MVTRKHSPRLIGNISARGVTFFQVMFWIHQLVLGIPAVGLALNLIITRQAEGALYSICFFLAWIGGSLTWGFATLIHKSEKLELPGVFGVRLDDGKHENGFDGNYRGYPYREMSDGTIEVETANGLVSYRNWRELTKDLQHG